MLHHAVNTSNVGRLVEALDALRYRAGSEEGMGVLYGAPGEGKTTAMTYAVNRVSGVFLRARVTWTVTSMLKALCIELELEPGYFKDPMVEAVIDELRKRPRVIFMDESDYLLRQSEMLDVLRDIYDNAKVPIVLVGMEKIALKMGTSDRYNRFKRRITQWVKFDGISVPDTQSLISELCEIQVEEDVVEPLHAAGQANIGEIVRLLQEAEAYAGVNDLSAMGAVEFDEAGLFQGHSIPRF